jgi:hypothetical protein
MANSVSHMAVKGGAQHAPLQNRYTRLVPPRIAW